MDNETLLQFDSQGIIPGPSETEDQFLKRADYCLKLKETLTSQLGDAEQEDLYYSAPLDITKKLYGISPSWVPLYFSNDKLAPWHGGCAWIFQMENAPTGAFLQLRRAFKKASVFLGIYQRDELIAHEMAHVGRMMYNEPKFEEFFAYQSSTSSFRKYCGGLIESPLESMVFAIVLFFVLLTDLFLLFYDLENMIGVSVWLKLLPLGMILAAFIRLVWKHRTFDRCFRKVNPLTKNPSAFVYRLTDREIVDFAGWESEDIQNYMDRQQEVRWRVIKNLIS